MLKEIDLEVIKSIALEASEIILSIYNEDFSVTYKADNSPLTQADLKANDLICRRLKESYPGIHIMSEETKAEDFSLRKDWEYYWCIDPIDGTKEFVKRTGEFTVNIALMHKNLPVLGVVHAPIFEVMYSAKKGEGAFKNGRKLPLHVNKTPQKSMCVAASKSHLSKETQLFIDALDTQKVEQVLMGSSLKLCMVAEGVADIYPRLAPTMEWDTAASHAIVLESGKNVYDYETDTQLQYNKENLLNTWFIVR
ncbi:3'(2'),5'-bisphosphate nucleotidase CysQ [Sulfurimonas sp. SAG-AH-194-I05]|nr:3'(2'),5'-bisphosphate nucleotidase CysQ [Sulfurimonas sp. SAG-AH-194-I05]MDF1875331.1 3'(2'),5'-bisphosphate nucleotidase CysQ [Sulfurimonas sp. SAG-AH-194-I05]